LIVVTFTGAAMQLDAAEEAISGNVPHGGYQAARIVDPPQGRQRAARVVEAGTLGTRGRKPISVVAYEDLLVKYKANGEQGPNPQTAFREITASWMEENNFTVPQDCPTLDDPATTILAEGGFIYMALAEGGRTAAGCLALHKRRGNASKVDAEGDPNATAWELCELGVLAAHRRQGAARLLL